MKIKNLVIMGLALAMLVMPLSTVVQNVEAQAAELTVAIDFYDVIDGAWYDHYEIYAFRVGFTKDVPGTDFKNEDTKWIDDFFKVGQDGDLTPGLYGFSVDGVPGFSVTISEEGEIGKVFLGPAEVGTLRVGYWLRTEDEVYVTVTLNEEPVGGATVRWAGNEDTTDDFGETEFTAPFYESTKYKGKVQAVKEYGTNKTIKRSASGKSDYGIYVVPYDLSKGEEFLGWWSHFALTEEAQAMYTAAEVLGDWQNWAAIFGAKGANLAKFIKGFPQFMVDRGKALEATHNMLDTIWALFTLLPALVLASPQLLKTLPMRLLQFYPALFINLPIFMDGISQMVIDLGVFMTSLAPSILMLVPEIFNKLPNIIPNAMNIGLTTVEFVFEVIPAILQYLPAAMAARPAFWVQMLQAFFYSAPDIFDVVLDEAFSTVKNLFRSWALFPAGIVASILAVAPAVMMLPPFMVLTILGRTAENTVAALGDWAQLFREAPSRLLDPATGFAGSIISLFTGRLIIRYAAVLAYLLITGAVVLPFVLIAKLGLVIGMFPLGILAISMGLALVAVASLLIPGLRWIAPLWMVAGIIASFAATVPGTIADILDYIVMRAAIIFKVPGYAVGWFFDGIMEIINISLLGYLKDLISEIFGIDISGLSIKNLPDLIAKLKPLIVGAMEIAGKMAQEGTELAGAAGKAVAEVAAAPLPGV